MRECVSDTVILDMKTAAKMWRASVGRFNDNVFKYAIGGEI